MASERRATGGAQATSTGAGGNNAGARN